MKKVFKRFWKWAQGLKRRVKRTVTKVSAGVNKWGEAIADALDNENLDKLVALTTTDKDDHVLRALRAAFAQLFPSAGITGLSKKATLNTDEAKKFAAKVVKEVKGLSKPMQNAVIHKAGSIALKTVSDSLSESDADTLVQLHYSAKK